MKKLERAEKRVVKKLSHVFELPKEVVMNLPLITIIGKEDMTIENYKGVVEYSEERIRVNTSCGIIKIEGRGLLLNQITSENIGISGVIYKLEFMV